MVPVTVLGGPLEWTESARKSYLHSLLLAGLPAHCTFTLLYVWRIMQRRKKAIGCN
jgi:hypothetical protein